MFGSAKPTVFCCSSLLKPAGAAADADATQVEALAVQKFGSLSKLEDQKQQRMRGKLDKRAQKRKAAEEKQEREEQQQQRMQQAIDRYTSQHDTADRNAGAAAAVEPGEQGWALSRARVLLLLAG